MIIIIDYGLGNLGSMLNMFKKIGAEACIASDPTVVEKADKLILPGVGSFDAGMQRLQSSGLITVLKKLVLDKKIPILGICLGMQLLTKRSEEGLLPGLGWLNAETIRFKFDGSNTALKIPHMGWNQVSIKKEPQLFSDLQDSNRFYFVHSYYVICEKAENILAKTHYGFDFTSAVIKENIMGVQFHPEKSHKFGMLLLKNFAERV